MGGELLWPFSLKVRKLRGFIPQLPRPMGRLCPNPQPRAGGKKMHHHPSGPKVELKPPSPSIGPGPLRKDFQKFSEVNKLRAQPGNAFFTEEHTTTLKPVLSTQGLNLELM